ncbi:hypothetical protein B0O80DRAFT_209231 [Mortierella sp. GBAus27b]|nr:hypothetical protein B0O80DRAFT_209231 [Mortierella sp. GBAus27b]
MTDNVLVQRWQSDAVFNAGAMYSISKIREKIKVVVGKLAGKRSYTRKQPGDKREEQLQVYQSLRAKYLRTTTLPNGILDQVLNFLGEPSTHARKRVIEPVDSQTRLEHWRDIVQSVFYRLWLASWSSVTQDPTVEDPFPGHEPQHNYIPLLASEPETSDTSEGNPDPTLEELPQDGSIRTCSTTLSNIVRQEYRMSGTDSRILETIENAQLAMTNMTNEIYTMAHMATLMIAGGGAVNGPVPGAGFDMRSLIPIDFRPSEDTFQWNLPVAPITMQSSIENGATSPDDRFKLLGSENLKFWFSRLLAPGGGRASATGNHPLWASFLEGIRGSGYQFQQIPPGLSSTAGLHIQQAATSIGNLWSGNIYNKSFKHLALNALRLQLAPNRFIKGQIKKDKQTVSGVDLEQKGNNADKMPRSQ